MSPGGVTLAVSGVHQPLRLLDWTSGKEIRRLDGGVGPVTFSRDGKLLASAESNNSIRLWDVATGKELLHSNPGQVYDYSPDARLLACRTASEVGVWDAVTGKPLRHFPGS